MGLLSRNVKVQGDEQTMKIRYGAHIMMRGENQNVSARFTGVEVTKCGQAFMMGRYPIHYHMIGNVAGSYIKNCSVHDSFNRGTTIHGVHYLHLKNNVYYTHMGHGIFWEDSIETNNIVENCLVMNTNKSTSLLLSDITPAGMWITRPKNIIRNNSVCGSQSFGYWYDLPSRPTGPSAVAGICPLGESFGIFENNTSHNNGVGIRIYPQYIPRKFACSSVSNLKKKDIHADNPPVRAFLRNNILYGNS